MNRLASALVSGATPRADGRGAADGCVRRSGLDAARVLHKAFSGAGLVLAALIASCAARTLPPLESSHPASPEAAEATPAQPATFLGQPGGTIAGEEAEPAPEMHHRHMMMHGGGAEHEH